MDFLSSIMACLVLLSLALFLPVAYGQQLVPALFIFGDSVVDVGNNNNLRTLVKANFAPYGRDFVNHTATGRFSNGKIAIDFIAKRLLFTSYQPPYLNKSNATTRNLLIGANFASAASGYYEETANIFLAIPLSKQLEHYKEYQEEVVELEFVEEVMRLVELDTLKACSGWFTWKFRVINRTKKAFNHCSGACGKSFDYFHG
ncbi:GDSL esterase/lipase [Morus notabilis]|uniref:GDSL esterase/lipase n=1 Tax=Morus notabilis TaxID=981085 RepID=W9RC56_9ROSA|nr:GDSL esterase/lipase [Morus notabilis]